MKYAILAILPISFLASCEDHNSTDCPEISIDGMANVDYSSGEWWSTDTGELIGYSISEDSPIYSDRNC